MFSAHFRARIDRVEEGIDQLPHAGFAEVVAGGAEVRPVPIAGPVPPTPVAMIHVRADAAHQVGDAEDFAVGAFHVRVAAGPAHARLPPAGALHPVAEHADGGKPRLSGVIPKIAVLPVENLVAGLVQIAVKEADERLRRDDRLAGGEHLLVAGDLQLNRDGPICVQSQRRCPMTEVVPADDHSLAGVFGQQGVPGGVARRPHAESESGVASSAAGKRLVGVERARLVRGELLRLQHPGAGLVLAAGHPMKIERMGITRPDGLAQEPRLYDL